MKTISSKNIISKVFRDFGVHETNFVHNAVEWIGEIMERIGTTVMYEKTVCNKQVCDHRVCLPSNLERLDAVVYNGKRLRLGADSTAVGYGVSGSGKIPTDQRTYIPEELASGNYKPLQDLEENEVIWLRHSYYEYPYDDVDYYTTNPGYINTSFSKGDVLIYYSAFPVDETGFPMLWDNVYVREACAWGVMSKLLLSGYKHPGGLDFQYAKEECERMILLARNANFPGIDRMEKFRNMWVRMVPEIDAYSVSFQHSERRGDIFK